MLISRQRNLVQSASHSDGARQAREVRHYYIRTRAVTVPEKAERTRARGPMLARDAPVWQTSL